MGIGSNPPGVDAADYVLDNFKRSEQAAVAEMVERSLQGLTFLASSDIPRTMNVINQNTQ